MVAAVTVADCLYEDLAHGADYALKLWMDAKKVVAYRKPVGNLSQQAGL